MACLGCRTSARRCGEDVGQCRSSSVARVPACVTDKPLKMCRDVRLIRWLVAEDLRQRAAGSFA